MERRRVRRRGDVTITHFTEVHDRSRVNFVKPAIGDPWIFGEEELFLLLALDGRSNYAAIEAAFVGRFGTQLPPREFERFLYQLYDLGMIETVEADDLEAAGPAAAARPGYLDYVPPEKLIERVPWGIGLVDPSPLLRGLAWLGRPLKRGIWLLAPFVWFAGLILFRYHNELFSDLAILQAYVNVYLAILCAFFVDNLASRLIQGAVATAFGADIRKLGVSAFLGVLPRFFIEDMPIRRLSRSGMLWSYAAPALFRLFLLAGGVQLWITFRAGGSGFAWFGLLCAELGFWSALLSIWPILPGDAYRWLCTYTGDWGLRVRALNLMLNMVRGRGLPRHLSRADRRALILFGGATIVATAALATGGFLYVGYNLVSNFQGTGMVLWTGLCCSSFVWLMICFRNKDLLIGLTKQSGAPTEQIPFDPVEDAGA